MPRFAHGRAKTGGRRPGSSNRGTERARRLISEADDEVIVTRVITGAKAGEPEALRTYFRYLRPHTPRFLNLIALEPPKTAQERIATEIKTDQASWGHSRWVSNPASTSARQLTFLDAMLAPGQAHSFHKHPSQEEVMYVVAGNVEQWIDREKRVLDGGDAAFIPAGMVHATFNTGKTEAHLIVVFSPCVGDGFEAIDVSSDAPWKGLRELV